MNPSPLKLAVVGHTNTGKTSLVRTLLRSGDFGEVADRGGTTRQVASVPLIIDDQVLIELYDSPGLENAPELMDTLDELSLERHDGPERVARLLEDESLRRRFDHEARVLELTLGCDVALYVIDVREPVLEKYKDELAILGLCGRPIVAVMNFTASPASREPEWRDALARVNLHNVLAFDAVVREPATELRLFEKLAGLLDGFTNIVQRWLDYRREEEAQRRRAALRAIAEMLVDLSAYQQSVELQQQSTAWSHMQSRARQREQTCVETLLDLYQFGAEDHEEVDLPLSGGQWDADLFDDETLRHYGIRTGKYAGLGAGTGAAIDIGTGGLTLGTGTLVGTLIGTGAGLARSLGRRVGARIKGEITLALSDATLRLLASRQIELLDALVLRGHASQKPVAATGTTDWKRDRLPGIMRRARFHPEWSSMNPGFDPDTGRDQAIDRLADVLASGSQLGKQASTGVNL